MVSSLPLVVHLGSWGHSVYGKVDSFLRLNVVHKKVDVVEDRCKDLVQILAFKNIPVKGLIILGTPVENSIKVNEEVICGVSTSYLLPEWSPDHRSS